MTDDRKQQLQACPFCGSALEPPSTYRPMHFLCGASADGDAEDRGTACPIISELRAELAVATVAHLDCGEEYAAVCAEVEELRGQQHGFQSCPKHDEPLGSCIHCDEGVPEGTLSPVERVAKRMDKVLAENDPDDWVRREGRLSDREILSRLLSALDSDEPDPVYADQLATAEEQARRHLEDGLST